MRLAPVALHYWREPKFLRQVGIDQSRTTHGAPEAVSACAAYASMIAAAIAGKPRHEVLRPNGGDYARAVANILRGSWRGKPREQVLSSGYVVHSLEAALWSIGRTAGFAEAVLTAANLGEDADTTAALVLSIFRARLNPAPASAKKGTAPTTLRTTVAAKPKAKAASPAPSQSPKSAAAGGPMASEKLLTKINAAAVRTARIRDGI